MRILEPAKLSDLEAVNALAVQVHELHVRWQPQFYESVSVLYDEDTFQRAIVGENMYVAKLKGETVGYVTLFVSECNHTGRKPARTMKLEELCVTDSLRGQGIGRQIMEDVKALALEKGCTDIRLTCAPENTAGIGLYEASGMKVKVLQYYLTL